MPTLPPRTCREPGCAETQAGPWCAIHQPTEEQRGYGREHRRIRLAGRPLARCGVCGSRRRLQLDHIVPRSLGGTNARSNLRWLCAAHHARLGARSNRMSA